MTLRSLCVFFLLFSGGLLAQSPYGRVVGRIVDTSDAVIPGASIRITNMDTNVVTMATSDAAGNYEARNLISGQYQIAVEKQGFKKYERGPIEVRVGDVLTIDAMLEVGAVSESITVNEQTPLLEAASANVGQVVDRTRLENLPMPSSASLYLTQLVPGVMATTKPTDTWQTNQSEANSNIAVNGTRTQRSEVTINGMPDMYGYGIVNLQPAPEMLEEFRVQTAPFDASVGRFLGARIDMVTKAGTNRLHGTLTYQHNDRALIAVPFFANRNIYNLSSGPVTKDKINRYFPPGRMNRYRAFLSGPVYLAKVYDGRDRTFFSFGVDGFRRDFVPSVSTLTTPTAAERNGDFSSLRALGTNYQIYDPATIALAPNGRTSRQPFAGNVIPPARIDPAAKLLLAWYPLPNATGTADGRNNYISSPFNQPRHRNDLFRVDHVINQNNHLFFSYARTVENTNWAATNWSDPRLKQHNGAAGTTVTLDDVMALRSDLVVNVRYGLNRNKVVSTPVSKGFDLKTIGLPNSLISQLDTSLVSLPRLNINGISPIGGNNGSGTFWQQNYHDAYADVSHARGNHSLRFGVDYRVYQENNADYGFVSPSYTFNAGWTVGPLDSAPAAPIGQGLASFMLGLPTGGTIDRNTSRAQQSEYMASFFQDDWKVSRKLTLNLGLRYEVEWPTTERYNRANRGFDFSAPSPIQAQAQANYKANPIPEIATNNFQVLGGLLFAGVNGVPRGLWEIDTNTFSPRFGFAYRLREKTVVRGGYGIFFDSLGVDRYQVLQQGFNQSTSLIPSQDRGLSFRATLSDPFPDGVLPAPGSALGLNTFIGQGVNLFWPDRKPGYVQRWSLNVQEELPSRVLLEVGYVGNRGTGLDMSQNVNFVPAQYMSTSPTRDQATINYLSAGVPNPFYGIAAFAGGGLTGTTVSRSQLLTPYPQFTGVSTTLSAGTSWYHSLQVRAERRFSQGYTLQASYTWSKFMEATSKLNPSDAYPTHTISDLDRPQHLVISGMYALPVGKGKHFLAGTRNWVNQILGGWSVQGIYQGQSGPPIGFGNIIFNGNLADMVLPRSQRTVERWFNTDADFDKNSAHALGSNIRTFPPRLTGLRADGYNSFDLSVFKAFKITEALAFQLRGEAQNALNHCMFNAPNTDPTSTAFGQITGGSGGRVITVGARMSW